MSRRLSPTAFYAPSTLVLLLVSGCTVDPGAESGTIDTGRVLAAADAFRLIGERTATATGTGADADGDGYGTSVDCDDGNASIHPGATEVDNQADDDCDGWVDESFVAAGDIVVTEVNRQARFGARSLNNDGTWIEVYNRSSRTVDLANWTFARGTTSTSNQITLDPAAAPILGPGEYAVFCDTDNYQNSAGVAYPLQCDYVWGDETQASTYRGAYHDNTFYFRRDNDAVSLYVEGSRTTGRLVDTVQWTYDATNGYWPRNARFSMSLDPSYVNATQNDLVSAWCSTTASSTGAVSNDTAYRWYDTSGTSSDEFGTPGAANYNCPNDPDLDGDGYSGATDCNDSDATINPAATETCDGVDEDCDGIVDDGTAGATYYADADADGYGNAASSVTSCATPAGYVANASDCDDSTAASYPGATEVCDGMDNDCDGSADEGVTSGSNVFYADVDSDGYGDAGSTTTSCTAPSGYTGDDTDCDDLDPTAYPGAAELDNLVDDDCDGSVDEDFVAAGDLVITEINRQAQFGAAAVNNDGTWVEVYNSSSRTVDLSMWTVARGSGSQLREVRVDPAAGVVVGPGEYVVFCDTDNYQGSAGAAFPLTCDYVWGDETQASTYRGTYHDNTLYLRRDSDTFALYVDGTSSTGSLIDGVTWYYDATNGYWPRDARFSMSLDDDYRDATLNDRRDVWCSTTADASGRVSNNTAYRWYDTTTTSNDEHGTPAAANYACQSLPDLDGDGYTGTTDCDDTDPAVHPGATESCNGIDDDCNGTIDDGSAGTTYYGDTDADGYGDSADTVSACAAPSGYVAVGGDCDDASGSVYPGATELCNGVDDDCDGAIDDGAALSTFYTDADSDGYGNASSSTTACTAPAGTVADATDCNDADAGINPGATEVCNDGIDNDCDAATTCTWAGSQKVSDAYDFRGYGDVADYAVGTSIADNGDFNGDGYDDPVVGQAFWDSTGVTDNGRMYVWYGPVDTSETPSGSNLTIDGDSSRNSDWFGSAAQYVGDFDNDGFDDLLVGAYMATSSNYGAAYLFLGGTTPTTTADAYATFTGTDANGYVGYAFSAGDIDLSGTPAVAVGGYGRSSSAGAVGVWANGAIGGGSETISTDATVFITGATAGDNLGYSVSMGDDLDGDGAADLVVGAPATASSTTPGKAYVFYGVDGLSGTLAATAADATLTGAANGDRFGYAVVILGDTDGDGQNDLLVTADKNDGSAADAGAAYVFDSAPTGSVAASSAATTYRGEVAGDFFGRTGAALGDIDGDGYDDMLIGATAWDLGSISGAGAAYLFYGPFASGTSSAGTYDARFTGSNTTDAVGYAVAGGGDVNADGFADFMISAPSWDSYGLRNAGGSWLYYGATD